MIDNLSAVRIADIVRKREISALEVAKSFLERIERVEPAVRAWAYLNPELVLANARQVDANLKNPTPSQSSVLAGVPIGIKDIFNTIDMPTCMGSKLWEGFTPGNDARVVFYLRQAGAQIMGKTVTAEFAVHSPGPTKNPYNHSRIPGTSSSGSAVAVATGMVPISLGTQTAGSIVRPASYCGIYGFKPSYGLLPRTGVLKTTDTLDCMGFFVRHFEDIEPCFETLRVRGLNYPLSDKILSSPQASQPNKGERWKVAFVKTNTWENVENYTRSAIAQLKEKLGSHPDFEVHDLELPAEFGDAHEIHSAIYDKCLSYYFRKEFDHKSLVSLSTRSMIEHGLKVGADEYHSALNAQVDLTERLDSILADYDFIISHSTVGEAPELDAPELDDPCLIWSLCGVPALHLPLFKGPTGMPFGVQIIARKYHDPKLFSAISRAPELQRALSPQQPT